MSARPFVSFVGAGPGDPELVTLKALRRLREAAVVVHDRLIPAVLLAEAAPDAEISFHVWPSHDSASDWLANVSSGPDTAPPSASSYRQLHVIT